MLKITYYYISEMNWLNYFINPLEIKSLFNYYTLRRINDKLKISTRAIDEKTTGCYNNVWLFVLPIYNIII